MKNKLMKYFSVIVAFLFLTSCNEDSSKKKVEDFSTKHVSISYPLPKTNDSLSSLLKLVSEDTNKVLVLNKLGWSLMNNNPDTAITLGNQALLLAEQLEKSVDRQSNEGKLILKVKAKVLGNIGVYYWLKADYLTSTGYHKKALTINQEIQFPKGIARDLQNIGLSYSNMGDYINALDYYLKALPIYESIGDKNGLSANYVNIGNIYFEEKEYDKSMSFHLKALKLGEELNDSLRMAAQYGNIGMLYTQEDYDAYHSGDPVHGKIYFDKAMENCLMDKQIATSIGDDKGLATVLTNISTLFADLSYTYKIKSVERSNLIDSVKLYSYKANMLCEKNGDLQLKATNIGNLGSLCAENANYKESYDLLYKALEIHDSLGSLEYVYNWYEALSKLYQYSTLSLPDTIGGRLLNPEQMRLRSLFYYKKSVALQDTIYSQENKKQLVRKEMNYEFDKKEASTKAENDKKEALANEQLKEKEKERNYFIVGFALVLLLAGFIFRGYKQKQKANDIISFQKHLVEEKQKEIIDSITYARRIQRSLLPTESYIQKTLTRLKRK